MAYQKVNAIFSSPERKSPGSGGIFSIFVSDLCKGCAACVTACGDHNALKMVAETEEVNAEHTTGTAFLDLLPDTSQKYLGLFNAANPADSKTATLRNMLMVRTNYDALVSGDGACAGCGEKSVLRSIAAVTEAYMRPVYHAKSDRFLAKAGELEKVGVARLAKLQATSPAEYALLRQAIAHLVLGLGGEDEADTRARIAAYETANGLLTDAQLVEAIAAVLLTEAFNHKNLQAVDGRLANGMSVMAMAAHTGCNTVYGSTAPNNPHPYPWMNSLFQDGVTVGWLMGESFIVDHARRSVIPERLADILLTRDAGAEGDGPSSDKGSSDVIDAEEYYHLSHFTDALMTDREIVELPKVWAVGGDGGMGDIGYQNMSKVILQNRPNVKVLMLDTQVYSNTGGQNSDSTPMLGGNDMNVFGAATQGKNTEKKTVRPSWRRSPWPTHPSSTAPSSTGWSIAAPCSSKPSPPASLSTAWPTIWRSSRPSACATRAACRSSSSIPASAKPIRRLWTSRAIPPSIWIGTRPRTRTAVRRAATPSPTGALPKPASAIT